METQNVQLKELIGLPAKASKLVSELCDAIPVVECEGVQRFGTGFLMSNSALGDSWLPEFYDFNYQREKLIEIIKTSPVGSIGDKLEFIFKNNKESEQYNSFRFNPIFINKIKSTFQTT